MAKSTKHIRQQRGIVVISGGRGAIAPLVSPRLGLTRVGQTRLDFIFCMAPRFFLPI